MPSLGDLRFPSLLSLLFLGPLAPAARADTLTSTRGEPVVETRHLVRARFEPGLATLRVERVFQNCGRVADQAELRIELPRGAAAVGLRIRGAREWYEGQLMESRMAAVVYESLTGFGPWPTRDPALLFWIEPGELGLSVFPVPPGGEAVVEYTLLAPLPYRAGRHVLFYPAVARQAELARPSLILEGARPGARLEVDGRPARAGALLELGRRQLAGDGPGQEDVDGCDEEDEALCPTEGAARLELEAPPVDVLGARYGLSRLADGRAVVRLEIDAGVPLRPAPRGASVVFVLDASRSFRREGLLAALQLVEAYAAHLPDARFEVVLFHRRAERLLVGDQAFTPAPRLEAALKQAAAVPGRLEVQNGSHLEAGLGLAAELLRGRRGPRRIVAVTDGRMRTRYEDAWSDQALAPLGKRALLHVVELVPGQEGDEAELSREDDALLAPLALARGGILATLDQGCTRRDYALASLELVRPVRLDGFRVLGRQRGAEIELEGLEVPPTLDEGTQLRYMELSGSAPDFVVVEGRLWAEPFSRVVPAEARFSERVVPALVIGSELVDDLDELAQLRLATAAGAVSPQTSYLSIEPGARPSLEGLERGERSGVSGMGARGSAGVSVGAASASKKPDLTGELTRLARQATRDCFQGEAAEDRLTVSLEVTLDELVDVFLPEPDQAGAPLRRCVEEALWALDLPDSFDQPRVQVTLGLGAT
ncbi:MAG TPA: VWA domain-containing protein [Myxococcota bacterium]|nr:VWA domain-containing protein [Myxococcota bacterium]HRY95577.1 VWA domain-containing protein [Myxococcota bacterium]HSA22582.1 VWA domain-containing protein [Myxococcota bacterium]